VRLDAHAVPELTLTPTASLQVDGLTGGADALVFEAALERRGAMGATIGWSRGADKITACRNWGGQLAHRDLLVCDVWVNGG